MIRLSNTKKDQFVSSVHLKKCHSYLNDENCVICTNRFLLSLMFSHIYFQFSDILYTKQKYSIICLSNAPIQMSVVLKLDLLWIFPKSFNDISSTCYIHIVSSNIAIWKPQGFTNHSSYLFIMRNEYVIFR